MVLVNQVFHHGEINYCLLKIWKSIYINYRLNKVTIQRKYPFPRIADLFDQLKEASYFSKTYLRLSYRQYRVRGEDVPKTAFQTMYGNYECIVMSFDLKISPAAFMAIMNKLFQNYNDSFVIGFIHHILVYSKKYCEHMDHLTVVLQFLKKHQLFSNYSKCEFW